MTGWKFNKSPKHIFSLKSVNRRDDRLINTFFITEIMKSIKCPKCNLTNWAHDVACKRCGLEFGSVASPSPQSEGWANEGTADSGFGDTGWQQNPQSAYQNFGQATPLNSGLALASMVVGIVAFPTSFMCIGILLAPVALVMGIIALVRTSKKPLVYGGKGFAIAGIATSSLTLLFMIPIIAAIAIPNLLASRRAANEGSAISSLRILHDAEQTYMAVRSTETCGDLRSLGSDNLIDSVLATGQKSGYVYEITNLGDGIGCDLFATPISNSTGTRSFMISDDGVIRSADKKGLKANKNDKPMNF